MNTPNYTFSVTDLRHKTVEVLEQAISQGFVYLFRRSKPEVALVNVDYLTALQQAYEDYLDTLEFDKTISLKRIPLKIHERRHLQSR